ncbi:Mdm33 family-domain-containing protein [Gorgonomyces haynaldii]|nr:Mdm33 family-domain-containing protein [Gorgonomyces haynaldii]
MFRLRRVSSLVPLSRIEQLGMFLNRITGYHHVEGRKHLVLVKETEMNYAKESLQRSKQVYEETIEDRKRVQKDLAALYQRQDTWTETDINLLAELAKKDRLLDSSETQSKLNFRQASAAFDKAQAEYLSQLRERYVEEQMYSDKIRSANTYWTFGLISTHFLIFMLVQLWFEPRKKDQLRKEISDAIENVAQADRDLLKALTEQMTPKVEFRQPPKDFWPLVCAVF